MNTELTVRTEEYTPEYPIGEYIKRWAIQRRINQKEINLEIGYSSSYAIFRCKGLSVRGLFAVVEFMSKYSSLPEEFYLYRMKQVIKGEYKWRK